MTLGALGSGLRSLRLGACGLMALWLGSKIGTWRLALRVGACGLGASSFGLKAWGLRDLGGLRDSGTRNLEFWGLGA